MKIAGYIADLLFEYECVVIPGLGGFLTRDHAAYIHPMKHYFKPPHREVVFNPMLRTNDGLLLSHIARFEQLSYQEAKSKLDRFVLKCLSVLDEGKKIHFRSIGSISYNKDKQLVFDADPQQNYLSTAFGLSGFVSPPIKRDEFQRKVEKVFSSPPPVRESMPATEPAAVSAAAPAKRMLASKRPNRFRRQLAITGVAASILAAAWGVMNYETVGYYYNQYKGHASVLPFFYVSPNEYVIKNIEKFPVEAMVPDPTLFHLPEGLFKAKAGLNDLVPALPYKADMDENDKPVPVVTEEVVAAQTPANEEAVVEEEPTTEVPAVVAEKQESAPVLPVETQASRITATEIRTNVPAAENQKKLLPATKSFYIIAGAFKDKQNAEKLIQSLKDKQFEASFAGQTNGGLWRVSYGAFASEEAAAQQLQSIRQHENAQAWILAI